MSKQKRKLLTTAIPEKPSQQKHFAQVEGKLMSKLELVE